MTTVATCVIVIVLVLVHTVKSSQSVAAGDECGSAAAGIPSISFAFCHCVVTKAYNPETQKDNM